MEEHYSVPWSGTTLYQEEDSEQTGAELRSKPPRENHGTLPCRPPRATWGSYRSAARGSPTQAPPSRRCRRLCPRWRRAPFPKGRGFSGCSLYAAQIRRWGGGHGSSRLRRPAVVLDDATAGSGSGMVLRLAAWATSGKSLRAELCASCGPSA